MYKVPSAVKKIALKGLYYNRNIKCKNAIGVRRARQLINQDAVSLVTIKKMFSYLSRAAEYYSNNPKKCGTVSFWLWGGKAGYLWTKKILKSL